MPGREYGSSLERKFPWSFLGCLVGTFFGVLGIYSVFFYSRGPEFRLQILSKAPVISVREEVPNLEILLDGTDVRKEHKGVSLLTLKVSNIGNLPIKTADFDPKEPFSLEVVNGQIIRSTILEKSEEYFETVWREVTASSSILSFPPFIIEPKQFFVVKFLVLHDEAVVPSIRGYGKIAGVGPIEVNDAGQFVTTAGEWPTSFGHNLRNVAIMSLVLPSGFLVTCSCMFMLKTRHRIRRKQRNMAHMEDYLGRLDSATAERLRPIAQALVDTDPLELKHIRMLVGHDTRMLARGRITGPTPDLIRMIAREIGRGLPGPEVDVSQKILDMIYLLC